MKLTVVMTSGKKIDVRGRELSWELLGGILRVFSGETCLVEASFDKVEAVVLVEST